MAGRKKTGASDIPVVLVTGGSRGIGRAIAVAAAAEGWSVVVQYNSNEDAARATMRMCADAGVRARQTFTTVRADLGSAEAAAALTNEVLAQTGRIDALVNNAGMAPLVRADLLEMSLESYERVLAVNLRAPLLVAQAVARHWVRSDEAAGANGVRAAEASPAGLRRAIINVNSVSAVLASLNRGEYCISKAGLAMVTKLFALRLAAHGVGVYELRPGIIDTDMTSVVHASYDERIAGGLVPAARWGTPEDVGRAAAMLLRGDLAFSTGAVITVDGGLSIERM